MKTVRQVPTPVYHLVREEEVLFKVNADLDAVVARSTGRRLRAVSVEAVDILLRSVETLDRTRRGCNAAPAFIPTQKGWDA